MSRTLPTELVRAMKGTESDLPLGAFLRVKHAALDNPLLVVNYPNEVRNTKGLWKPFPFSVTLPAIGDDQVPVLHVTVANITLELTEIARRIAGTADLAKCDIYIECGLTGTSGFIARRLRSSKYLLRPKLFHVRVTSIYSVR